MTLTWQALVMTPPSRTRLRQNSGAWPKCVTMSARTYAVPWRSRLWHSASNSIPRGPKIRSGIVSSLL
eukprot:6589570-Alexandrium_andersonii.AAC.1